MRNIWWIMGRDLSAYLRNPIGFIIIGGFLAFDGLLFNIFAVGSGNKLSSEVVELFFHLTGGVVVAASVFLSMRLIAEERQLGTLPLLATSTAREYQIVYGKFLAGFVLVALFAALTLFMPLLIYINGKVSIAHLAAGYLGVLLIGGTSLAIGLLCSALAPTQLVALVLAGLLNGLFILMWWVAKVTNPPLEDLLGYLSLHGRHFWPFSRGVISLRDVVFYVSFTYMALLLSTRVLEARRWH